MCLEVNCLIVMTWHIGGTRCDRQIVSWIWSRRNAAPVSRHQPWATPHLVWDHIMSNNLQMIKWSFKSTLQRPEAGQRNLAHCTGYLVFLIRSPSRCETEKRLAHLDLWDARITNFILFNYLKNSPGHFCLIMTRSPGMLVVSCFEIYYQSAWGRVHCSVLLIIFQSTERRRPSASVRIILNLLLRLDLYFIL